jgi:ABC-type branched-subunit amino acid transport system substrate-binding protein
LSRRSLVAVLALALVSAPACASTAQPIRIGLLVDCTGILGATHEWALAAAELPLLQHGGKLGPSGPDGGIHGATAGGRPIEILEGCSESGVYGRLIQETERLVQTEHVDAVIGATGWSDAIVMRDLARRFPTIPFIVAASWPREATAQHPAANLYRFEPDVEQSQAGLASYAYNRLGWRHAATVAEDEPMGWGAVAAFTRQFCALGGSVTQRWVPYFSNASVLARIPHRVNGVVVFEDYGLVVPSTLLKAYARRHRHVSSRLLLSLWFYPSTDIQPMRPVWPLLRGVTGVIQGTEDPRSKRMTSYVQAYTRAFPAIPAAFSAESDVLPFRNAMAALLQAIDRVHGDLGPGRTRLRAALASERLEVPYGTVTLDRHHQAVVTNRLVTIDGTSHGEPLFHTAEWVPRVSESLGGLLAPADSPRKAVRGCASTG